MPVRTVTTLECELTGESAAISGELAADASNLPEGWTLVQLTQIVTNPGFAAAAAIREQRAEEALAGALAQAATQGHQTTDAEVEAARDAIEDQLDAMFPLPPAVLKRTILAALAPGQEAKLLKALDNPEWVDADADDEEGE